jgi:hypothetical protein
VSGTTASPAPTICGASIAQVLVHAQLPGLVDGPPGERGASTSTSSPTAPN